jgi:hypothetical protein
MRTPRFDDELHRLRSCPENAATMGIYPKLATRDDGTAVRVSLVNGAAPVQAGCEDITLDLDSGEIRSLNVKAVGESTPDIP